MRRQRLLSTIVYCCMAVSVFLLQTVPAMAAETDPPQDGEIAGEIEFVGTDYYVSPAADLGEYDFSNATSLHTQTTYGYLTFTNQTGNALERYVSYSSFDFDVPVNVRVSVERGHTYSGQMEFVLHMNFPDISAIDSENAYRYKYVMLDGFTQQSNYDGITTAYYGFINFGSNAYGGECSVSLVVTFDNYQPTFSGTLNINSVFNLNGVVQSLNSIEEGIAKVPPLIITNTVSSDWAGEMYDYPTDAVTDSTGGLLQNQLEQSQQISQQQMQQNQQIAQEQEQKESQRFDDLLHGFDTSDQDKEQSDFDNELNDFHEQEENILQNAMGNIDDIDFDFDFNDLSDTFSLIRIIFEQYILSMGDFSTIITLTLTIAVALFAVGWFRG